MISMIGGKWTSHVSKDLGKSCILKYRDSHDSGNNRVIHFKDSNGTLESIKEGRGSNATFS